ncbi:MAG: hypothetical protein OHK0013_05160 [Sandaracinaceae bacterium]
MNESSSRPRGFALLHKAVAYLLAYLGLAGLALGGEIDPVSLVLLVVGYAATWGAEGARLHDPRWQRGWTIGLVVLLVVQLGRALAGEPYLASALTFSGALQAARLANRRSAREYLQIALLAFLHLCAATALSTEIVYGLTFLGFVIVVPWMLALTHLRAEIESHHRAQAIEVREAESSHTPDDERITLPPGLSDARLARVLSSRRLVGAPFLAGTAVLSVPLFAMTALLFVLFPRVGLGFLAFGSDPGTSVAGFGDQVELGQVGRIRDDPTVVLRVTPPALGDRPPRRLELHLRGTSFDHYDGRRWSRTGREGGRPLRQLFDEYAITRTPRPELDQPYRIVLDHLDQAVVFLPPHTVALEVPPRVSGGVEAGRNLVLYPGLDVRYEDADELGLRYTAWVSTAPSLEVVPALSGVELARYLQVPDGHERVAELARAWTAGARTDRERAQRILGRLRGGEFTYSLDMQDPGDRPPLERFLLEWRRGHCEYYASAMAIMLRTLGVPTRNVTGFLGGRWNDYGRYYAVRSGDAHAWIEAYLPGEGWVAFDPTPGGVDDGGLASLLDELRNLADAAIVWWELRVVGYDLRSQRNLARDVVRWLRTRPEGASGIDEGTRARSSDRSGGWAWVLPVVLVVAALAVWGWARRRTHAASPTPERARRVVALYRSLEAALAAHGVPRPASCTPLEHAAHLSAIGFAHASLVRRITERYNDARFGMAELSAAELEALEEDVARLSVPEAGSQQRIPTPDSRR